MIPDRIPALCLPRGLFPYQTATCIKSPHIATGLGTAAVFVLITRHTPRGHVRVLRGIVNVARNVSLFLRSYNNTRNQIELS